MHAPLSTGRTHEREAACTDSKPGKHVSLFVPQLEKPISLPEIFSGVSCPLEPGLLSSRYFSAVAKAVQTLVSFFYEVARYCN